MKTLPDRSPRSLPLGVAVAELDLEVVQFRSSADRRRRCRTSRQWWRSPMARCCGLPPTVRVPRPEISFGESRCSRPETFAALRSAAASPRARRRHHPHPARTAEALKKREGRREGACRGRLTQGLEPLSLPPTLTIPDRLEAGSGRFQPDTHTRRSPPIHSRRSTRRRRSGCIAESETGDRVPA